MRYHPTLLMSEFVTHDVKRFIVERPEGLDWQPGQGVELALDLDGWREQGRPFTPTSHPGDGVLEFTIKRYPAHDGVTERLHRLAAGARLHMSEPFGTITDQGPGVFVAGGAGVTPFLAILRRRAAAGTLGDSELVFANKTRSDVICEKELRHLLGERCHLLLSREEAPGYGHGRVGRDWLTANVADFRRHFYLCGPDAFVQDLREVLVELGASPDSVVFEE